MFSELNFYNSMGKGDTDRADCYNGNFVGLQPIRDVLSNNTFKMVTIAFFQFFLRLPFMILSTYRLTVYERQSVNRSQTE